MNNVSWFIYLAEVTGNISVMAGVVALVLFIGLPLIIMGGEVNPTAKGAVRPVIITLVVCLFTSVVVPSRTTMYAIAASEVGEETLKSPTATKAMKALDAWLDKQISEENPNDFQR